MSQVLPKWATTVHTRGIWTAWTAYLNHLAPRAAGCVGCGKCARTANPSEGCAEGRTLYLSYRLARAR